MERTKEVMRCRQISTAEIVSLLSGVCTMTRDVSESVMRAK